MFKLLKEESKKRGLPLSYKEDLKEDEKFLNKYKGKFFWILREHGTVMLPIDGKTKKELGIIKVYLEHYKEENFFYYFNGEKLEEISNEKCLELLENFFLLAKTGKELSEEILEKFTVSNKMIKEIINFYSFEIPSLLFFRLINKSKKQIDLLCKKHTKITLEKFINEVVLK